MRDLPNSSPRLLVNVISQLLYESFFRLVLHLFQWVKTSCLPTILIQLYINIYVVVAVTTSNQLDLRIKQHLPARILNHELKRDQLANTSGSSIAEHMINSRECVADLNVDRFSIQSRSHSIFHLKVLETLYFRSLQPFLRKQGDCLLGLNVISLCSSLLLPPLSVFCFFFHYIPPVKNFLALTAWQEPGDIYI